MYWGQKTFNSPNALSLLNHFDLSGAELTHKECEKICSWYSEVIINKNYFYHSELNNLFNSSVDEKLLLILGSSCFLHTVDLLERHSSKIHKIIELDFINMDSKQQIYDLYWPAYSKTIKCFNIDYFDYNMLRLLKNLLKDFFDDIPVVVILPGVSNRSDYSKFSNILETFKSSDNSNTILFDYIIDSGREDFIPRKMFELMLKENPNRVFSCYSTETIKRLFALPLVESISDKSIREIEFFRTGTNTYFADAENDWMHFVISKI